MTATNASNPSAPARAVITGGKGFVGAHLRRHLEAEGDTVVLLDRDDVDVVDLDAITERFERHRPEVVYHLAALSHVGESWDDPDAVRRVNVGGTESVLRAAERTGVRTVLVVGSSEEYGTVPAEEMPIAETRPARPTSPYGASKAEATALAAGLAATSAVRIVIARPFNHTGAGQSPKFLIPALAQRIAAAERDGHDSIAVGNLDPIRDISDVRDVARAYRLLVGHGATGEIYNVCSGRGVAVREIVELLAGEAGHAIALRIDPDLVRPVDIPVFVGDHAKLRAATGWRPEIALATTLRDVLDQARRDLAT